MLSLYVSFGLPPDRFWRITPRELRADLEGARRARRAEQNNLTYLAWQTANLTRSGKLPPLQDLMLDEEGGEAPPEEQSHEELVIALDQFFLAYGGDPQALQENRAKRTAI